MSLKYTEEYFPNIADIPAETIATERQIVVSTLQAEMPDVDMTPGTPTGDLVITPLAVFRAAANEANSHFMSDLDLSNVADGLIYSCDFVRAYLGNFAVYDVENLRATGLVRLTYSSPEARTLATSLRFRFGGEDVYYLKMADTEASDMVILTAGSSHTGDADTYTLTQTSATTWSVDVPVETVMTAPVLAGASGTVNMVDDDLVGAVAAITFLTGLPSASLSDLAAMARKIAVSLTGGSKSSFKTLVLRHWPETTMVSPVTPGDEEMQRSADGTALALQAPSVDVYLRSVRDMSNAVQIVRLDYVGAGVFRGKCNFSHRPSSVSSVAWSGTTDDPVVESAVLFSKSSRSDLYGSLHCGSRYEDFYLEATSLLDSNNTPLVPLTDDMTGDSLVQYALFSVVYDADPLLETVASLVESSEYKPTGVDVLVKSGPLVTLSSMTISYHKTPGVNMLLTAAADRVAAYALEAGYPSPFSQTAIYDIMRDAGASRTVSIACNGSINVTPATRIMKSTLEPEAPWDGDWLAGSDVTTPIEVVGVDDIVPSIIIDSVFEGSTTLDAWAATYRTLRYYIAASSITFVEVL